MRSEAYKRRFRWVQCQLDYLQTLNRDSARRKAIENLPPGLPETYRRILQRIGNGSDNLEVAKKALMWLIFCKRPLRLTELAVAIAVDPTDECFDDEKKLGDDEKILEICSSFIKMDERTRIVEVAHFSVVEYFTSPLLPDKTKNPDFMDKVTCNAELLKCCLAYLSFPQFEVGPCQTDAEINDRLRDNELLGYAAQQWQHHGDEIKAEPVHQEHICEFFSHPCRNCFLSWLQIWQKENFDWIDPKDPTGIYYAVKFGYDHVVQSLLEDGARCREDSRAYGNALLSAADMGIVEIVQKLVRANADLSVYGNYGWSALHFAAWRGYSEIVKILLDAKADVNVKNKDGWTALHRAARNGHTEVVKLLLDAKADVNAQNKDGWTALHIAARNGHTEVVKLLLDAKADVNAQDKDGWTALQSAAWNGHTEVVKLLLDAKADVNVQNKDGWTALQRAAWNGHTEVVKLLLDAKADVNAQNKDGETALQYAAWNGHTEVVKLLLDAKADVNIQDKDGWTALHSAAWHGHYEVVDLLFRALSSPAYATSSENISFSEYSENSSTKAVDLLKFLILKYPNDSILRRSLGNEYVRQKRYKEASVAFDMSMYITMKEMKATRVDDITTNVICDDCGESIRGSHYKCVQCGWNYDTCQACMDKSNHPHSFADFITIPSTEFTADEE